MDLDDFQLLKFSEFIDYVINKVLKDNCSLDACTGEALASAHFNRDEMVRTKILYNYIDLGFVKVSNSDLPMKLRINKRKNIVRVNRRKLGRSI